MILKDYVAKLPIDKIVQTELLDDKIKLPVNIETNKFYKDFKTQIKAQTLTDEKALFVCSTIEKETYKDSIILLNSKLKFAK